MLETAYSVEVHYRLILIALGQMAAALVSFQGSLCAALAGVVRVADSSHPTPSPGSASERGERERGEKKEE